VFEEKGLKTIHPKTLIHPEILIEVSATIQGIAPLVFVCIRQNQCITKMKTTQQSIKTG
jgi:hypothetical protein